MNVSNDAENSLNSLNLTTNVDKRFFCCATKNPTSHKRKKNQFSSAWDRLQMFWSDCRQQKKSHNGVKFFIK